MAGDENKGVRVKCSKVISMFRRRIKKMIK